MKRKDTMLKPVIVVPLIESEFYDVKKDVSVIELLNIKSNRYEFFLSVRFFIKSDKVLSPMRCNR